MSNPINLTAVYIDAAIDIRNSKGSVHSKQKQLLWAPGLATSDGMSPDGRYHRSLYPACNVLGSTTATNTVCLQFVFSVVADLNPALPAQLGNDQFWLTDQNEVLHVASMTTTWDSPYQLTQTVCIQPNYATGNFPWGFAGQVMVTIWPDGTTGTGCTQQGVVLEIYTLSSSLPAFYHGVVPVKFLRTLVLPAKPVSSSQPWREWAINALFTNFGFQYNIVDGSMKYAGGYDGGPFDLGRWVRGVNKSNLINCYDQAAIVQIALGLGPDTDVEWMYMVPYGFIKPANLVGYPGKPCNSPFGQTVSNLNVLDTNTGRTFFRNHAFIKVNNYIADACAGPHLGTETLRDYITNAIQSTEETPSYTNWNAAHPKAEYPIRPGKEKDAGPHYGVSSLDGCDIRGPGNDKDTSGNINIAAVMKIAESGNMEPDVATYNISLAQLQTYILLAQGLYGTSSLWDVEAFVNPWGVEVTWDLPNADKTKPRDTEITIYICQDANRAARTFQNQLMGNSAPWASTLAKPAGGSTTVYGNIPAQLMVTTKAGSGGGQDFFAQWTRGNAVVAVSGMADSVEDFWTVNKLTDLDQNIVNQGPLPTDVVPVPEPAVSGAAIASGVTHDNVFELVFTLGFQCDHYSYKDLNVDDNRPSCLDLIVLRHMEKSSDSQTFTFTMGASNQPRAHNLQFCFVDRTTSRIVTKTVPITVN